MNDSKAPGPDGFTSLFFKKAWSIVGSDVIEAVESFFNSGCMLLEINCTIIALVPKVPNPESMQDYRPISCCNTIYKCISKIIASRIKMCLPDIINPSQSAFVHGRSIEDNVLITQDLMHNYHGNNGRPRCALKIDIKKAYDTIGWSCVIDILYRLGTPVNILKCIKACITTPSFSVAVNGELAGFFASKRCLRQGDPLSPLLFIIVMEAFSRYLYVAAQSPNFEFHPKCEGIKLTHVSFADDIFLFAGGTTSSVRVIMDELNRFENFSGLQVNKQKGAIFLAGISDTIMNEMLNITGFSLGKLPMKYLGVPLLSTRLSHNDCQPLIDKIMVRIQAWTSRSLSFAGRLQLLSSVPYNIQMYWCSMFIIPKYTIAKIEQIFNNFLWSGKLGNASRAKIRWEYVCLPKEEGGLGLRRVKDSNDASVIKHIWKSVLLDMGNGKFSTIKIEYPWAPQCCFNCKFFGHNLAQCHTMKEQIREVGYRVKGAGKETIIIDDGRKTTLAMTDGYGKVPPDDIVDDDHVNVVVGAAKRTNLGTGEVSIPASGGAPQPKLLGNTFEFLARLEEECPIQVDKSVEESSLDPIIGAEFSDTSPTFDTFKQVKRIDELDFTPVPLSRKKLKKLRKKT